jgi:hypothetical protein
MKTQILFLICLSILPSSCGINQQLEFTQESYPTLENTRTRITINTITETFTPLPTNTIALTAASTKTDTPIRIHDITELIEFTDELKVKLIAIETNKVKIYSSRNPSFYYENIDCGKAGGICLFIETIEIISELPGNKFRSLTDFSALTNTGKKGKRDNYITYLENNLENAKVIYAVWIFVFTSEASSYHLHTNSIEIDLGKPKFIETILIDIEYKKP